MNISCTTVSRCDLQLLGTDSRTSDHDEKNILPLFPVPEPVQHSSTYLLACVAVAAVLVLLRLARGRFIGLP